MRFVKNCDDFVGEQIGYVFAGAFSDLVVIGTKEGSIMVIRAELDDDERIRTYINNEWIAAKELFNNDRYKFIERDLVKAGVVSDGEYKEMLNKRAEEAAAKKAEREKEHEEEQYHLFLRLKQKYEPVG